MLTKFFKDIFKLDGTSASSNQFDLQSIQNKADTREGKRVEELFKTPKDEEMAVMEYLRDCEELRISQMIRKFLQCLAERTDKKW